jgi:hypothetical protein
MFRIALNFNQFPVFYPGQEATTIGAIVRTDAMYNTRGWWLEITWFL